MVPLKVKLPHELLKTKIRNVERIDYSASESASSHVFSIYRYILDNFILLAIQINGKREVKKLK